jgi:hypothetical protein
MQNGKEALKAQRADSPDALVALLSSKEREIREVLESPRLLRARLHPELVKALARIATRLAELQRYIELEPGCPAPYASLKNLVECVSRNLNVVAAWELAEGLEIELLWFIPTERLWSLIEAESRLKPHVASDHWNASFPEEDFQLLRAAFSDCLAKGAPLPQAWRVFAVERLATLYEVRADSFRHARALAGLRARYFRVFFVVLALLLLISVGLVASNGLGAREVDFSVLISTLTAGALGATLSGIYKLRDSLTSIRELRSNQAALTIQPLVGAAAAFALFAILRSGLVTIAGFNLDRPDWAQHAILGFLAGFSEPFFLGTVNRLSHLGESRKPPPDTGEPVPPSSTKSLPVLNSKQFVTNAP